MARQKRVRSHVRRKAFVAHHAGTPQETPRRGTPVRKTAKRRRGLCRPRQGCRQANLPLRTSTGATGGRQEGKRTGGTVDFFSLRGKVITLYIISLLLSPP